MPPRLASPRLSQCPPPSSQRLGEQINGLLCCAFCAGISRAHRLQRTWSSLWTCEYLTLCLLPLLFRPPPKGASATCWCEANLNEARGEPTAVRPSVRPSANRFCIEANANLRSPELKPSVLVSLPAGAAASAGSRSG